MAFSEQAERRAFVDHLVAGEPRGYGRAAEPVKAMLVASRAYRDQLAAQDPAAEEAARLTWRKALDANEQHARQKLAALEEIFPRVASLFKVPAFPMKELLESLTPRDVLVTALLRGKRVILISLVPGVDPASVPLSKSVTSCASWARRAPGALERELAPALAQLTRGARRVYLDLGRLSPELAPERVLPGLNVVRLATLWELVDAYGLRNLAYKGGLWRILTGRRARPWPRRYRSSPWRGKALTLKSLSRPFEEAGISDLGRSAPLRRWADSTNLRLLLFDEEEQRLGDLRLSQTLGLPLRGHLLVVPRLHHTPGQVRAERVALTRFIHAAGIPSLLIDQSGRGVAARAADHPGASRRAWLKKVEEPRAPRRLAR